MARATFGLPVYNGAALLPRALDSLLAQDYGDFEVHISDNASDDETPAICERYAARDGRVRYRRNERNIGATNNFNLVFEQSSSELFAWAAHDDLWEPSFLRKCVAALDAHPEAVMAHTWMRVVDFEERPYAEQPRDFLDERADLSARFRSIIQDAWSPMAIYGVMRASALRQTRMMRQLMGGDMLLLAELALRGSFVQVPEPLWIYHTAGFSQGQPYIERIRAALGIEGRRLQNTFPTLVLCGEYLRALAASDHPPSVKAQLAKHVLRWYVIDGNVLPFGRAVMARALGAEKLEALLASLREQPWYRRFRHLDR